jgi:NAD(P) transhydrogenase subunit alpha
LRRRRRRKTDLDREKETMTSEMLSNLYVLVLAAFLGFEVIKRVSPLLHTPLMSLTNALDAIAVVGAIVIVGEQKSTLATVLGTLAVIAATSNVVGGFLITDRMLRMFKTSPRGGGPKK